MWTDECQLLCCFVSPTIVIRCSKLKSVNPEVFFRVMWFWNHLPLDDISLSYHIILPDLFTLYCVAEWRLCVTFLNLRISVKRDNESALYTLLHTKGPKNPNSLAWNNNCLQQVYGRRRSPLVFCLLGGVDLMDFLDLWCVCAHTHQR